MLSKVFNNKMNRKYMEDTQNWYADCLKLSKTDNSISNELNFIAKEVRSQS